MAWEQCRCAKPPRVLSHRTFRWNRTARLQILVSTRRRCVPHRDCERSRSYRLYGRMIEPVRGGNRECLRHHLRRKLWIFRPGDQVRFSDYKDGILDHFARHKCTCGLPVEMEAEGIPDF